MVSHRTSVESSMNGGWTEEQTMLRSALRRFVQTEVEPWRRELESGQLEPYEILRSYYRAFDVAAPNIDRLDASLSDGLKSNVHRQTAAEAMIPMIEFACCSPGLVTAMGVTTGLTAGAILRAGDAQQKERWARDLLTLDKIGAWALTEPDSGSDAFGSMRSTARRTATGYLLNGSKTFITNAPFADTIVFICRLEGADEKGEIATFVLDRDQLGVEQSGPVRKMGLHASPTGEVHVSDVEVGEDRRLQGRAAGGSTSRAGARATFTVERASAAAMALGIIERCLELSVEYAMERTQFGRPILEFQLIQLKLAEMEVARINVENLVLRYIATVDSGERPSLAEASAMKLYAARAATIAATEAVQIFGGNGYMAENHVEQLYRDARVLQIYGGTDEIQVTHVARGLVEEVTSSR